jgi:hypothetical protein
MIKLSEPRNSEINIPMIEDMRSAKFVGILPVKNINQMVYVFYNKEKHPRGSHYFGITRRDSHLVILDAGEVEGKTFNGILRKDGTILHSYYRHDYVVDDLDNMVDGGSDYFKHWVADGKAIAFSFKDGELICVPPPIL